MLCFRNISEHKTTVKESPRSPYRESTIERASRDGKNLACGDKQNAQRRKRTECLLEAAPHSGHHIRHVSMTQITCSIHAEDSRSC